MSNTRGSLQARRGPLTAEDEKRRLALRQELDRTCHAVTQSGLELERFYGYFSSELHQIEQERRHEVQIKLDRKMLEMEVSLREK